jgi:hypothetical protein
MRRDVIDQKVRRPPHKAVALLQSLALNCFAAAGCLCMQMLRLDAARYVLSNDVN